jgi:hypothetical protein
MNGESYIFRLGEDKVNDERQKGSKVGGIYTPKERE